MAGYAPSSQSELAPVVRDGKPSAVLLIPVIQSLDRLEAMRAEVETGGTAGWESALAALSRAPFDPPTEMKRMLNAYSDNIYTSDLSRRNMYLDGSAMLGLGPSTFGFGTLSVGNGGAAPTTDETLAYLYRNEALGGADALRAEIRFLLQQRAKGIEEDTGDMLKYLKTTQDSLRQYLALLPKDDVAAARAYVAMKAAPPAGPAGQERAR